MLDKPPAVIFDVDGTLADVSGIRHYVVGVGRGAKDFRRFHLAASFVRPVPGVVELAQALDRRGFAVLVVTARSAEHEYRTRVWLRKWGVPFNGRLWTRQRGDYRPDFDVKRDILARIRERYDVVLAVDDNPNVLALWRRERIPAVIVPGWDDEKES